MISEELLKGRGVFANVPPERLAPFAAIAEAFEVTADRPLFHLGEHANWLYFVDRGRVDLSVSLRVHGAVKEMTVQSAGPGEILAWSALVAPHVLTLNARATESCRLVRFPGDGLAALCHREPAIGLGIIWHIAEVVGRRLQQVQAMWLREVQLSINGRHA